MNASDNEYIPGSRVKYGKRSGTVIKVEFERNGSLDCLVEWDQGSGPKGHPITWVGANQLEPGVLR